MQCNINFKNKKMTKAKKEEMETKLTYEEQLVEKIEILKKNLKQHEANINFTAGALENTEEILAAYLKNK